MKALYFILLGFLFSAQAFAQTQYLPLDQVNKIEELRLVDQDGPFFADIYSSKTSVVVQPGIVIDLEKKFTQDPVNIVREVDSTTFEFPNQGFVEVGQVMNKFFQVQDTFICNGEKCSYEFDHTDGEGPYTKFFGSTVESINNRIADVNFSIHEQVFIMLIRVAGTTTYRYFYARLRDPNALPPDPLATGDIPNNDKVSSLDQHATP